MQRASYRSLNYDSNGHLIDMSMMPYTSYERLVKMAADSCRKCKSDTKVHSVKFNYTPSYRVAIKTRKLEVDM